MACRDWTGSPIATGNELSRMDRGGGGPKVGESIRDVTAVSHSHTHLRVYMYATSTSYIHAIAFSARLNSLQVDQVDRENDKRTSTCTYTQLVPSKLIAACNAHVQLSGCGLTINASKCLNASNTHLSPSLSKSIFQLKRMHKTKKQIS